MIFRICTYLRTYMTYVNPLGVKIATFQYDLKSILYSVNVCTNDNIFFNFLSGAPMIIWKSSIQKRKLRKTITPQKSYTKSIYNVEAEVHQSERIFSTTTVCIRRLHSHKTTTKCITTTITTLTLTIIT